MAHRMQMQQVQARAQRHAEIIWESQSAEAAPGRVASPTSSAIYCGQPFRTVLLDLGLTPNQVWGLAKTDEEWSTAFDAALTATRRDDLQHGTNAAYVHGCVCSDCREHQRQRMAKMR